MKAFKYRLYPTELDFPFAYVKGMASRTLHEILNPTDYALLLFTAEGTDEDYQRLNQLAQEVQHTYGDLVVPIFVIYPHPIFASICSGTEKSLSIVGIPTIDCITSLG